MQQAGNWVSLLSGTAAVSSRAALAEESPAVLPSFFQL